MAHSSLAPYAVVFELGELLFSVSWGADRVLRRTTVSGNRGTSPSKGCSWTKGSSDDSPLLCVEPGEDGDASSSGRNCSLGPS